MDTTHMPIRAVAQVLDEVMVDTIEDLSGQVVHIHELTQEVTEETVQAHAPEFHRLPQRAQVRERIHLVTASVHQPTYKDVIKLPFDPKRVYQRSTIDNSFVPRQWVTIQVVNQEVLGIFCNVCMAFANQDSAFTKGFRKYSHIYERLEDHEGSKSHNDAVLSFINAGAGKSIDNLVNREMVCDRKQQVLGNVEVLKRILAVIKHLGKSALPLRGTRHESGIDLHDNSVNHGNFLETILLLAQYDVPLATHISRVVEKCKERKLSLERKGKEKSRGRGNLTTMLSKTA